MQSSPINDKIISISSNNISHQFGNFFDFQSDSALYCTVNAHRYVFQMYIQYFTSTRSSPLLPYKVFEY